MDKDARVVKEVISKILKTNCNNIELDDDLVEKFGMDSMQRVEIIIELEKIFDITISDDEAPRLRNVKKILEFTCNK